MIAVCDRGSPARSFPNLTTVEGLKFAARGFGKNAAGLSCCAGRIRNPRRSANFEMFFVT